ncbi:MAG TPA: glycosyltransferase [Candidatus Ozemobacteraceae bacterium]|nr:glycosyltransferase [Candidatus Ozemobacteraceae bacterium]
MPSERRHFTILTPVFNDWSAAGILLARIDEVLRQHGLEASVLLVDDGSPIGPDRLALSPTFAAIPRVDVLPLKRNLGHQRAICIGLCHLESQNLGCPILVMDSDGEDAPEEIPRLWERFREDNGRSVVFAARAKRSEGYGFRTGYFIYQSLYYLLTGSTVDVGNFSLVPSALVSRLVTSSDLWSHYAAAIFHCRIPWVSVPTARAKRLDGASQMNLVSLVVHGLSSISVFSDQVGARLLLVCLVLMTLAIVGILVVVGVKLFTPLAIPGWATMSTGILGLMLLQASILATFFIFLILNGRNRADFIPCRDFRYFLDRCECLYPRSAEAAPPR